MKQNISRWIVFALAFFLAACSTTGSKKAEKVEFVPKTLNASGTAVLQSDSRLTEGQARLSAQQTATMNAYRSLAATIYREPLTEGLTVGGQVMRDEQYRIYLDTYMRDAKIRALPHYGRSVRAHLTLTLTDRFYRCMSGSKDTVQQCLQQDNKMPFTRLGYQQAAVTPVNLACAGADCSDLLHVQGFANGNSGFSRGMLNAGLYDGEWTVNTATRLLVNFFLLNAIPEL